MQTPTVKISKKAKAFIEEKKITDATFDLQELDVAGCCVGVAKEIQTVYRAPADASGYRYFHVDGFHIFVSRKIRILGPLTLTTEGLLWPKRLILDGATVPI
ncbi:MAG: hypothetical protein AMJ54_11000 [Deltaproteobacteria bacterium SG8_13]|nr:MAG: hypothetical protein AMJ54_11000 [Deltaproteobacteria bacterium SG8_13]